MFPNTLEAADSARESYRNVGSVDKQYRIGAWSIRRTRERAEASYTYPAQTLDWLIEALDRRYESEDAGTTRRFLRENPFLFRLLLDAHQEIRDYFGPDTRAALRVVADPEAREDERLFVFVQTGLAPEEALARLSDLDDGWWLEALSEGRHKMTIDVEYV